MPLELRLLSRGEADRVVSRRRRDDVDAPWEDGYPLEGDMRACAAYASRLPASAGPDHSDPFGYYQVIEDGLVVGGIGFHGPPNGDAVEVGYGVVPAARGRGVATAALRQILDLVPSFDGVQRVVGRTEADNGASQGVMLAVGMRQVGRDPDFLHFEIELQA